MQSECFLCPEHSRTKKDTFVSHSYIYNSQLHLYITVIFVQFRSQLIQSLALNFDVLTASEDEFLWPNWTDKAVTTPWGTAALQRRSTFHLQLLMKHINFNAEAFVELGS